MSFGDETGDYSTILNSNFNSVDSEKLNNKLNIEETYAEIYDQSNISKADNLQDRMTSRKSLEHTLFFPVYATVDMNKKRQARKMKSVSDDAPQTHDSKNEVIVYEDLGVFDKQNGEDNNIYELVS